RQALDSGSPGCGSRLGSADPARRSLVPHCHGHRRPASFRNRIPGRNAPVEGAPGPPSDWSNRPASMTARDLPESLQRKLESLPSDPGVYLWKDQAGSVLYVGKARSLRSRVRSYLGTDEAATPQKLQLVRLIHDVDTIVVQSESQSLLLENNLIKEYQPR